QLLIWDINIIFGGGTRGTPIAVDGDLFEIDTANVGMTAIYNHPQFRRAYWRTLRELAEGPLVNANVDPFMDARFRAFAASGVNVGSPDFIKLWISQRRAYILSQLATVDTAPFSVTTPTAFSTDTNLVAITGTAPLGMTALTINGIARLLTWTSLSNWTVRVPLDQANNPLTLNALDHEGHPLSAPVALHVQYTGALTRPEDAIVINELMY